MGRQLDRIGVKGYKSIRELDLDLSALNILIGANGAGKTNFISLFKLLNEIVRENLQTFVRVAGGADTFLYFGAKTTSEILIKLDFGVNSYECTLVPTANDSLIFADEKSWFHRGRYIDHHPIPLGSGHKETKLHEIARTDRVTRYVLEALQSWKVYHFHDTSDTAKIKKTGDISDNKILQSDASNLAAFLYLLQERYHEYYQKIVATIRLAAPFFDNFVLQPDRLNSNKIQLEWREKGSDTYFNANSLSDGTLRFICLTTLLLQPNLPSTILIDEPELGLHPYAITLLAAMLRGAAEKTQVIVSTQSVPLVNQFDPEDIIIVDREGEQSTFRRPTLADMESWLEEYGLGDLWEKNLIGGRPQR
ncbi:MAG: chromosome segregation protein SMC [Chloroflexota bacterium]|nr:MAG: chromosome segregation protein SMC [Chloroflexota bacterium]